LESYDADGGWFCDGFGAHYAVLGCTIAYTNGTHTVLAFDENGYHDGSYVFYLQRLNDPVNATVLPFGATLPGSIGPGQVAAYTFNGVAGQEADVEVMESGPMSPEFEVYGAETWCSVWDQSVATLTCPLDNGVHTILVYDHVAHNSGSFEITLCHTETGCVVAENASISLVKKTNGQDANSAPGPTLIVGDPITWTYEVTNTGTVTLTSVMVSDDQGVAVNCPSNLLAAGVSMTCTGSGVAVAGPYSNIGSVTGAPPAGDPVAAQDPSHYFGVNPTHLKLVKVVVNDNGGTAAATDWTLSAAGPTPLSGAGEVEGDVAPGTYALSESGPAGYATTGYDCGASVTLALGESRTCTITNNDVPAHLKLVKVVVNNNGGAAAATDWTLSAAGRTPIGGAGGAEGDVSAGTYTLSESGPGGYTTTGYDCGASVILALGESRTCTITNDDMVPDTAKPVCTMTAYATDQNGKRYIEMSVQDAQSGLYSITVLHVVNAVVTGLTDPTVGVPNLMGGTTLPVAVRATQINLGQGLQLQFLAKDVAGNKVACDPIEIPIERGRGKPVTVTVTDEVPGCPECGIPPGTGVVAIIQNGDPGVLQLTLVVNRTSWSLRGLEANEERTLDISSAIAAKEAAINTFSVTVHGKPSKDDVARSALITILWPAP